MDISQIICINESSEAERIESSEGLQEQIESDPEFDINVWKCNKSDRIVN